MHRPLGSRITVTAVALLALGGSVLLAAPAEARVRPYVLGNTETEPTPEITASRLGVSDADGNNLTWLSPAGQVTHHADASRDGRTLAALVGTNSRSSGDRLRATLRVTRDGVVVLLRTGRISPPDVTPDGKYVVWGQDRTVYRFRVSTRTRSVLYRVPSGQQVETVGYSPDRTRVLVTSIDFPSVGDWHLRLVRTSDGRVLLRRSGLFSDIYERPEWSPSSGAALVFWHRGDRAPRAVRVSRAGRITATAIASPLRSLNWRPDGIYALDPVANTIRRTSSPSVAPVLAWARTGPGRVLDSIVLLDGRPR